VNFKAILKRLTGISTPIFGVSWNPPPSERDLARKVITFLEDRRVLYNATELEVPEHCVASVIEIRRFLTDVVGQAADQAAFVPYLQAMRAACRKFLDTSQHRVRAPDHPEH